MLTPSNYDFGLQVLTAIKCCERKFLRETPTYRWLPIENETMLAQRALRAGRLLRFEHNRGYPIVNPPRPPAEIVKMIRKAAKRKLRAWMKAA